MIMMRYYTHYPSFTIWGHEKLNDAKGQPNARRCIYDPRDVGDHNHCTRIFICPSRDLAKIIAKRFDLTLLI